MPPSREAELLEALIEGQTALLAVLLALRGRPKVTKPRYGQTKAYVLSLMAETPLPVTTRALQQFAVARDGYVLDRRLVYEALMQLQREGLAQSPRWGRWVRCVE